MSLILHAHPFSSYCQKVLIALNENQTPFTLRLVGDADAWRELALLWPVARMPVLIDAEQTIAEATVIIEHLALHHPGPVQLLPADPSAALNVRFMDRVFDNYVMTPMQRMVGNNLRPADKRDGFGVTEARALLDKYYGWLETRMTGRHWASGDTFSMADCAAAPSLFYADWTHQISEAYPALRAYRARLLARPSFARAVDGGRPFRPLFPLGAPDRD